MGARRAARAHKWGGVGGGLCNVVGSFWRPVECCGDDAPALLKIHVDAEDVVSKYVGATIETGRMLLCGTLMWVHGLISCVVVAVFVCIWESFGVFFEPSDVYSTNVRLQP